MRHPARVTPFLGRLFLLIAVSFSVLEAQDPPIAWNPGEVTCTIGTGQGATEPVYVTVTAGTRIQNASFSVVPQLQGLVTVTPATIPVLEPATEYRIALTFSLPANVAQGAYSGTLHVQAGSRTLRQTLKVTVKVNFGKNRVAPGVTVLSPATQALLASISPDRTTLTFGGLSLELLALRPGAVLVLGGSPFSRGGFIGRVAAVSVTGTTVSVQTTPASLADAFTSLDIAFTRRLTADDLLLSVVDGSQSNNLSISQVDNRINLNLYNLPIVDNGGARITVSGSITIDPVLDFRASIQYSPLQVNELRGAVATNLVTNISVQSALNFQGTRKVYPFPNLAFVSFVIWAGPVPIEVTPQLSIPVALDGGVSLGAAFAGTQTAAASAGVEYSSGSWSRISSLSNSFTFQAPQSLGAMDAKVSTGAEFGLSICGVTTPYSDIIPYLELAGPVAGKWQLFGGLDASAGMKTAIFGSVLPDHDDPNVIAFQKLLTP